MNVTDYIKHVKCQSDCYEQTIQIIICFDSAIRFDDSIKDYRLGSYFLPGRRLLIDQKDTSKHVSPDVVSQLSDTYGVVAEVKFSASTDKDFTKAHGQLTQYDQDLYGWKTPTKTIKRHDLSLLVNDLHRNRAKDFFRGKKYSRCLTLVACARQGQVSEVVKIEKYEGVFTDQRLEKKMYHPVAVPIERLIQKISSVKFYDAEPPCVEYTMNVLWMSVFNELASQTTPKETRKKEITVDLKTVVGMLKSRFAFQQSDGMQPETPKTEWVRKALDAFIDIKYAKKISKNMYQVQYAPYGQHKSMLEVFAKKVFEANKAKARQDDNQLKLVAILNEK